MATIQTAFSLTPQTKQRMDLLRAMGIVRNWSRRMDELAEAECDRLEALNPSVVAARLRATLLNDDEMRRRGTEAGMNWASRAATPYQLVAMEKVVIPRQNAGGYGNPGDVWMPVAVYFDLTGNVYHESRIEQAMAFWRAWAPDVEAMNSPAFLVSFADGAFGVWDGAKDAFCDRVAGLDTILHGFAIRRIPPGEDGNDGDAPFVETVLLQHPNRFILDGDQS